MTKELGIPQGRIPDNRCCSASVNEMRDVLNPFEKETFPLNHIW